MGIKNAALALLLSACAVTSGCGQRTDNRPAPTRGADSTSTKEASGTSNATTASSSLPHFLDIAATAGIRFKHFTGARGEYYMNEIMGAGGALLDFDLDGDLDVYLVQGQTLDATGVTDFQPPQADSSQPPGNRLYRNNLAESGELQFTDVTAASGAGYAGYGMGVTVGDIDNDGDPDIYLTNYGPNVLLRNDGTEGFKDITASAGAQLDDPRWSTAAGFGDYDSDGDLDLFVVNYVDFRLDSNVRCTSPGGRRDYCGPQVYPPATDRLFRNDGGGTFTDVSEESGIGQHAGAGLGLVWADLNGDRLIDAYVANDGAANHLWRNLGDGRFEESGLLSGAAYNMAGSPEASMGVTVGDVDGDGDEDLFMTHLVQESNTLYTNAGNGFFIDATDRFRLGASSLALTGFGSRWFDYDNDGHLDLFVANGNVKLEESRVAQSDYPFEQRNQLFLSENGERFREVFDKLELARLEVSRGAAFGDVDEDGAIDILLTNNNGPARLLLNATESDNHWLSVSLVGTRSNRDGTGSRVMVKPTAAIAAATEGDRWRKWGRSATDGSYLSASDRRVHMGLGSHLEPVDVTVLWPTGLTEVWRNIAVDQHLELLEGTGETVAPQSPYSDSQR